MSMETLIVAMGTATVLISAGSTLVFFLVRRRDRHWKDYCEKYLRRHRGEERPSGATERG